MKRFHSVLPAAKAHHLRRRMLANFIGAVREGFWYCNDHDGLCDRVEGEQGQPAHCSVCGSHRIEFHQPALLSEHTPSV